MDGIAIVQKEVEIGELELRFTHTRVKRPEALATMTASLERYGQISPVIIVGESPLVLVDGYQRVAALLRLGRDTVLAEQWSCDEAESLIRILLRKQERRWEVIEEAWLIRELQERHRFSQDKVAALLGRHQSWVSRRLLLLELLPEEIITAVRQGAVSTWSATRVLAPMARAMPEHARSLAAVLAQERMATRDLALLWKHYQGANRRQREKIIEAPALFIKALRGREQEREASAVRLGPDSRWFKDLRVAGHMLTRLRRNVAQVVYPEMEILDRRAVRTGLAELTEAYLALRDTIDSRCGNDIERERGGDSGLEKPGGGDQGDLPVAEDLAQRGAPGGTGSDAHVIFSQPQTRATGEGALRGVQGQYGADP